MASWSRRWRRNAFGESNIGPGFPRKRLITVCAEAGATLRDVDHIAVNRKPGVNNWRRLAFVLRHRPDPRLMLEKIRNIRSAGGAKEALEEAYGMSLSAELHHVEHHHAHLASAFLVSGFTEAACVSIDGFGDFASTAIGWGSGPEITIDQRVYFPHSLGIFYSALTQFIGFPHYGDEYKVMGLAPYGEPRFLPQMRQIVRVQSDGTFRLNLRYFRHHTDNVSYSWKDCAPEVGSCTPTNWPSFWGRRGRRRNRSSKSTRTSRARSRPCTRKRSLPC